MQIRNTVKEIRYVILNNLLTEIRKELIKFFQESAERLLSSQHPCLSSFFLWRKYLHIPHLYFEYALFIK